MWWFTRSGGKALILQNGQPVQSKSGRVFGCVEAVCASSAGKILVTFQGGVRTVFAVCKFDPVQIEFLSHLTEDLTPEAFALLATEELEGTCSSESQAASAPVTKKRRSSIPEVPAKRQVVAIAETFDTLLRQKFLGEISVPVTCLRKPPPELLLRPIAEKHKERIKEGLKETLNTTTVLPVLLIGDDFSDPKSCQYYTLGGNHLTSAIRELKDDQAFAALGTIRVQVYKNLQRTEALRVASLHNSSTRLVQQALLKDRVEVCRSLLYDINNISSFMEPPQSSKAWRGKCALSLGKKTPIADKDLKSMEPTFQLALYSNRCYEKLIKMFELAETKTGKCLKQTIFLKLQGLPEKTKFELLAEVVSERLQIGDLAKEADKAKKLLVVQKELVAQLPNITSWEEAERNYPQHTTESAIQPFTGCNFKQGIPRPFLNFIKDAISWKDSQRLGENEEDNDMHILENDTSKVVFLASFSATAVKRMTGFTSAKLVVFDMEENTTQFETAKGIIGSIGHIETVICAKVSSGTLAAATQLLREHKFQGLVPSYHFQPGQKDAVTGDMSTYLKAIYRIDEADIGAEECDALIKEDPTLHIVLGESREGDWIVDLTGEGTAALAACEHSRNAVVIASGEAMRKIQKDVASYLQHHTCSQEETNSQEETDSLDEDSMLSVDSDQ